LLPLFNMMEGKLFKGQPQIEENKNGGDQGGQQLLLPGQRMMFSILANLNEKDASTVFNMCARICKIIMKKLSATHDTEFRGRV
jgi:hypothetical protein